MDVADIAPGPRLTGVWHVGKYSQVRATLHPSCDSATSGIELAAESGIQHVMQDPSFVQFVEFAAQQQGYQLPRDLPKMLFEWMKEKSDERVSHLDLTQKEFITEQMQQLRDLFSRGLSGASLHQQTNQLLTRTQLKVRTIQDDMDAARKILQCQHDILDSRYRQQAMVQQQAVAQHQQNLFQQHQQVLMAKQQQQIFQQQMHLVSSSGLPSQQQQQCVSMAAASMGTNQMGNMEWNNQHGVVGLAPAERHANRPSAPSDRTAVGMGQVAHSDTIAIEIPDGPVVNFIIGKAGGSIRTIEIDTSTRVQVHRDPSAGGTRTVEILGGTNEGRQRAAEIIQQRVQEFRSMKDGEGAAMCGGTHRTSGTPVNVAPPSGAPPPSGPTSGFASTTAYTHVLRLPSESIGTLIGPKGANVNAIQQDTRAKIDIDKNDVHEDGLAFKLVTVKGRREDVEHALLAIRRSVADSARGSLYEREDLPAPSHDRERDYHGGGSGGRAGCGNGSAHEYGNHVGGGHNARHHRSFTPGHTGGHGGGPYNDGAHGGGHHGRRSGFGSGPHGGTGYGGGSYTGTHRGGGYGSGPHGDGGFSGGGQHSETRHGYSSRARERGHTPREEGCRSNHRPPAGEHRGGHGQPMDDYGSGHSAPSAGRGGHSHSRDRDEYRRGHYYDDDHRHDGYSRRGVNGGNWSGPPSGGAWHAPSRAPSQHSTRR